MKRFDGWAITLSLAGALSSTAAWGQPITTAADLGVAVSAQIACGGVFVDRRTEAAVLRDDVRSLAPFTHDVSIAVDRVKRTVTAKAPGARPRTALYRPTVGCTLLTGKVTIAALGRQAAGLAPLRLGMATLLPQARTSPANGAPQGATLQQSVAKAFDGQNVGGYPDTRAIVVVQDGKIVAEHYATGFGPHSRFLGWSATKSIMGTLIGMLIGDGKLKLDAPAPVREWQAKGDPRSAITLRQLLNMTSGLAFSEPYRPGSDSIKMLFEVPHMASVPIGRPSEHSPGTAWSYSSGTSNILSEIVFRSTGGTLAGMNRFAQQRLFKPLGMTSAFIEPDETGVLVGSSYGYATAHDWARFGLLYLNDGTIGGKRLLSSAWMQFVRMPSADARPFYSGQFWLNRPAKDGPPSTYFKDLPAEAYMAMGHNAQMVMVIPSRRAVIVRLGWTPEGQSFDYNKYFAPIVAALPR